MSAWRLLILGLTAAALAAGLFELALEIHPSAVQLGPVALVLLPLLAGRFPGEAVLARWARAVPGRRLRPAPQRWPREGAPRPRRILLVRGRAVRPPPLLLAVHR